MRPIPFFSGEVNKIESYEKFYYTKSYIKKKKDEYSQGKGNDWVTELAEQIGYRKIQKFKKHMEEWNRMERKIPYKYLEIIGVERKALDFTLELDCEEFEKAKKGPFIPKKAMLRLHPAFYRTMEFPEGTDLEEAIEQLKEVCMEKKIRGFIEFWPVKTVGVRPDGSIYEAFNKPRARFSEKFLIPDKKLEKSAIVGIANAN